MSRPVAVVTGAARGIGRATALLLQAEGYDVAAYDLDPLDPDPGDGHRRVRWTGRLDVTSPADWTARLQELWAETGRLDLLVNNAGVLVHGPLGEVPLAAQARVVDVNVKGVLYGCATALPHLRRTPGSCVVNVSSASALYGQPDLAVYSATKSAVCALTEALELEWRSHGVRVVDVLPLFVRTGMGEQVQGLPAARTLGVRLVPEQVAAAVLAAARDAGSPLRGPHRAVGLQAKALSAGRGTPVAAVRALVTLLARGGGR